MDKEVKHEEICKVLNTEQEKHPSLGQAVLANPWDSVESDTESLAQEKVYQKELQMRIGHHDQIKYIQPQKENTDNLQLGEEEDDNADDDETEDLQIYDSLDVATHRHAKRNPNLLQTEYLDTQIDERQETSQLPSDDAYSDLRYDPNWRTNLRGAGHFHDNPQISIEEYYQVPEEQSSQSCGDTQGLVIKGGYRYIVDSSPSVVVTPHMAGNEFDQPYRLHSPDDQTSSVTSPHNHALQLPSQEADHLKPACFFTKNESDRTYKGLKKKHDNSCDNAGENISRSPGLTKDMHAMSIQEFKTYQQQERRQVGTTGKQQMCSSMNPKVTQSKKPERLTEDIVERNKITLGRNTSKCGSYMRVHACKQETSHNVNKVRETPKETPRAESQEDSLDPEQMWLKKTQQLRVTEIRKGKKAQRKEHPNPPEQQQHPALGVKAEGRDCLSSPLASPAAVTQPDPQRTALSQPLLPAIHLNILLNTSSHHPPFIQQRGQADIIDIASLHGCPDWSPTSEVGFTLSPGCQQANPGKSYQKSQKGVKAHLHNRNLESSPEQWQRTTASKEPVSCAEGNQKWITNEVHPKQYPQNLPRTPTTPSSLDSGCYTVLPPIRQSLKGAESELSPGQIIKTAYHIHRSSSDGYLVQMEKQKQLRARVTYKAYNLKDYKQLKPDINLRGLGPDYKDIEKTKMKRQRLYSNVIREQNKNIRRIPFLLAKDPEGNDKKVPRIKALEYAKTIAKPPVPSQPKQRQNYQPENFTEHAPYLEDLDIPQLATLEVLRKRHEKEKQAVALLRKVHAV